MKRKRHSPDEIIRKLRDAEADLASGLEIAQICQKLGVSDSLVTMMAEDLMRRGYLAPLSGGGGSSASCGSACGAGCSLAAACAVPTARDRLPLLALTPRGRQMAA